jgi:quercetin dioxygenase-like cupin family protein
VERHTHSDHVDSFYVLEGEAEFIVGEETFRAGPGSFVAAPIGVVHGFRNSGGTELRMVNIHVPNTGFAARLRDG